MATTTNSTIPQDRLAARLAQEVEDLTVEVFSTTYGADWQAAITIALAELPDLIAYADAWDDAACIQGNLDACPF
jgi:hypothetical protein